MTLESFAWTDFSMVNKTTFPAMHVFRFHARVITSDRKRKQSAKFRTSVSVRTRQSVRKFAWFLALPLKGAFVVHIQRAYEKRINSEIQ